jgi:hypothetical protein
MAARELKVNVRMFPDDAVQLANVKRVVPTS